MSNRTRWSDCVAGSASPLWICRSLVCSVYPRWPWPGSESLVRVLVGTSSAGRSAIGCFMTRLNNLTCEHHWSNAHWIFGGASRRWDWTNVGEVQSNFGKYVWVGANRSLGLRVSVINTFASGRFLPREKKYVPAKTYPWRKECSSLLLCCSHQWISTCTDIYFHWYLAPLIPRTRMFSISTCREELVKKGNTQCCCCSHSGHLAPL